MKFRSKYLRGNHNYRLVRYEDKLDDDLWFLSVLNNDFYRLIKNVSHSINDDSVYQGYVLYKGDIAAGLVFLVEGEKYLEIDFDYDETVSNMDDIINQLIDTCMYLYHDKEEVLVLPHRPIDLDGKRFDVNEHMTVYEYQNRYSNPIRKLNDEVVGLAEYLAEEHTSYKEDYHFVDDIDHQTASEYYGHQYPANHIFDFLSSLEWRNIESSKSTSKVKFKSDGEVKLETRIKPTTSYHSYNATYNVNDGNFTFRSLRANRGSNDYIEIVSNDDEVVSKYNNTTISCDFHTHIKRYYGTKSFHRMKMNLMYEEDGQGEFIQSIIEFVTIGRYGHEKGRFEFRIKDNKYTIYGITEDGIESVIKEVTIEEPMDYQIVDKIASNISPIITGGNELLTMGDLFKGEETISSYTKQVLEDIHLPHLKHILTNYLHYANKKSKVKEIKRSI